MQLCDFDYILPDELIAQEPSFKRDESRLMLMERCSGLTQMHLFRDIVQFINPGDALVLNDTRVFAARVPAVKEKTGGLVELFFLNQVENGLWKAMVRPGRRLKTGTEVVTTRGNFKVKIAGDAEDGLKLLRVDALASEDIDFFEIAGEVPLPPYIHRAIADEQRYQTVYAKNGGSVAAPTAGLHFTDKLLRELKDKDVSINYLTLHVGLGTFRPVSADNITQHKMHDEEYALSREVAENINNCKAKGGRVIAVGTTSVRTLETCADEAGYLVDGVGLTDKYIYPGYKFRCVDAMITNFHLPKSTLLMLVSAFAGRENTLRAYQEAIDLRCRFFSFGDAMFIY